MAQRPFCRGMPDPRFLASKVRAETTRAETRGEGQDEYSEELREQ
jgi:hypothetical protein